jgi:hypothetical protein
LWQCFFRSYPEGQKALNLFVREPTTRFVDWQEACGPERPFPVQASGGCRSGASLLTLDAFILHAIFDQPVQFQSTWHEKAHCQSPQLGSVFTIEFLQGLFPHRTLRERTLEASLPETLALWSVHLALVSKHRDPNLRAASDQLETYPYYCPSKFRRKALGLRTA